MKARYPVITSSISHQRLFTSQIKKAMIRLSSLMKFKKASLTSIWRLSQFYRSFAAKHSNTLGLKWLRIMKTSSLVITRKGSSRERKPCLCKLRGLRRPATEEWTKLIEELFKWERGKSSKLLMKNDQWLDISPNNSSDSLRPIAYSNSSTSDVCETSANFQFRLISFHNCKDKSSSIGLTSKGNRMMLPN